MYQILLPFEVKVHKIERIFTSNMLEQKSNPENIEVIETHSISQEAFINLGDESNHENVCPEDVFFRVLKVS